MDIKVEHKSFKNQAGKEVTARIISADPLPDKETFRAIHERARAHLEAVAGKPKVK